MLIKINKAAIVWNKPSSLQDGDVVEVKSFDNFSHKYYIGQDDEGREMFVDESDFTDGNAEIWEE